MARIEIPSLKVLRYFDQTVAVSKERISAEDWAIVESDGYIDHVKEGWFERFFSGQSYAIELRGIEKLSKAFPDRMATSRRDIRALTKLKECLQNNPSSITVLIEDSTVNTLAEAPEDKFSLPGVALGLLVGIMYSSPVALNGQPKRAVCDLADQAVDRIFQASDYRSEISTTVAQTRHSIQLLENAESGSIPSDVDVAVLKSSGEKKLVELGEGQKLRNRSVMRVLEELETLINESSERELRAYRRLDVSAAATYLGRL